MTTTETTLYIAEIRHAAATLDHFIRARCAENMSDASFLHYGSCVTTGEDGAFYECDCGAPAQHTAILTAITAAAHTLLDSRPAFANPQVAGVTLQTLFALASPWKRHDDYPTTKETP